MSKSLVDENLKKQLSQVFEKIDAEITLVYDESPHGNF